MHSVEAKGFGASASKFEAFTRSVKAALFACLYVQSKDLETSRILGIAGMLIEFLQWLSFPLANLKHFPWLTQQHWLVGSLTPVFQILSGVQLDKGVSDVSPWH